MSMADWWKNNERGNRNARAETCTSAPLLTINPSWTALESKRDLRNKYLVDRPLLRPIADFKSTAGQWQSLFHVHRVAYFSSSPQPMHTQTHTHTHTHPHTHTTHTHTHPHTNTPHTHTHHTHTHTPHTTHTHTHTPHTHTHTTHTHHTSRLQLLEEQHSKGSSTEVST